MNPGLNAVNAKNIVMRQTRLSSVRNAVNAFMCHAQILVRKNTGVIQKVLPVLSTETFLHI